MERRGFPVVVSAPSGTGKTTICREVASIYPQLRYSVSATTRPPRDDEVDGRDYHILDEETFQSWTKDGRLCEWAMVHEHYYGTPKDELERDLSQGFKVIMDLDVNGAEAIGRLYPDAVLIYLLPPSAEALKERLANRGTDGQKAIWKRVEAARKELDRAGDFHYLVINRTVQATVELIESILAAEESRTERQDISELLVSLKDLTP